MPPKHFVIFVYYYGSDNVIGSRRWREMSELLLSHGTVSVICADGPPRNTPEAIRVLHVPDGRVGVNDGKRMGERPSNNRILRTLKHYGQSLLFWPDRQIYWARKAVRRVPDVIKPGKQNIVITSGPRFSVHTALKEKLCAKRLPVHWVMDLRDPWTNDPSPAMRRRSPAFLTRVEARMEHSCHRSASLVTTVSDVMTRMMKRDFNSPAITVYNGYPESAYAIRQKQEKFERSICYLGSIIHNLRTPELLFRAARKFETALDRLTFDFWCNDPKVVQREAETAGVQRIVRCHPFIPLQESQAVQASAGANLVLNGVDPTADHMVTGKVFELVAATRPVIAVTSPTSELRSVLEQCGCNGIVWDDLTAQRAIELFLKAELNPVIDRQNLFSRKTAVSRLISALNELQPALQ